METVVLTFEKKESVKGNIFETLNEDKKADDFAKDRAYKINEAIFKKVHSLILSIAEDIQDKIKIDGVETIIRTGVGDQIFLQFHGTDCVPSLLTQTTLSPMYSNSSSEKYPIYSEKFRITVENIYTEQKGDTIPTNSLEKVEERILGDLKRMLKL